MLVGISLFRLGSNVVGFHRLAACRVNDVHLRCKVVAVVGSTFMLMISTSYLPFGVFGLVLVALRWSSL